MANHVPSRKCLVMEMKQDGRLKPFGKREAHPAHFWWYTSYGGGHQMDSYDPETDVHEKNVKQWLCLGREHYGA